MIINFRKFEIKKQFLLKHCKKSSYQTFEDHSITPGSLTITYYQTLKEVAQPLRVKTTQRKILEKLENSEFH